MTIADYIVFGGVIALCIIAVVGYYAGKGCGGDCNQGRRDCDCEDENGNS